MDFAHLLLLALSFLCFAGWLGAARRAARMALAADQWRDMAAIYIARAPAAEVIDLADARARRDEEPKGAA